MGRSLFDRRRALALLAAASISPSLSTAEMGNSKPKPGWKRVPLGPGGFISGLALHPDGTKMCRMDTSGAYRYNTSSGRWDMMVTTESVPAAHAQPGYGANPGAYELEIAPSSSARVYLMWKGYCFRSDDRGDKFIRTARLPDTFDSNDSMRGANKKLAVDPINPDVVICGGPLGVTLSSNAGASWTQIPTSQLPAATKNKAGHFGGYLFAFDRSSPTVAGKTQGIYCSVYGSGLYVSGNAGASWSLAGAGGPTTFYHLVVSKTGKVFVVRDVSAPYTTDVFMLIGNNWSKASTGGQDILGSIAIDPANDARVVASNSQGDLSVSMDGGATWSGYNKHRITAPEVHWLESLYGGTRDYGLYGGATLLFDPSASNVLYFGVGLGIVAGDAPTKLSRMEWKDKSVGLEQLCAKRLLKPSGGLIIAAVMDQGVFAADGVNYPRKKGVLPYFAAAWDADSCPTDPRCIAAIVNQSLGGGPYNQSGFTTDGGETWQTFANNDFHTDYHAGGMIAYGIDPENIVIVTSDWGSTPNRMHYTADRGKSWIPCNIPGVATFGPTGWLDNYYFARHNLCADRVNAGTFYAYNVGSAGSAPGVYRSIDGGANWSLVHAKAWPEGSFANSRLQSVPGKAGHLFYVSGSSGHTNKGHATKRSTDGGSTWRTVNTDEVIALGFGATPPGGSYPGVYIVGWIRNIYGIYTSNDNCASWSKIGSFPFGCFDTPVDITGDPDVVGDCYLSTSASGIFQFSSGGAALPAKAKQD